ncbi:hypothetical protein QR680_016519 [Steinernema hermaphroditum]|uniref:Saposin B-type domain-containing protein n=1 Tax=Steinernema hermaphroditum TaxID=289476 RepID=A0AA39LMT0_9BILA|nr:hypothetical protein QR680_016519 [Steinernema hermaphroditum]
MVSKLAIAAFITLSTIVSACEFSGCENCKKIVDGTKAQLHSNIANVGYHELEDALGKECDLFDLTSFQCLKKCKQTYWPAMPHIIHPIKAGANAFEICQIVAKLLAFKGCKGCKKMVDDVKVRFNNNFCDVTFSVCVLRRWRTSSLGLWIARATLCQKLY